MINRVCLTGRLTRDPILRETKSGLAVAQFIMAVNRQYTNADGERDADFINCVIWRKAAENFVNFTKKGSLVGVDGRIQTRSYEDKDGKRVYITEVVVDNFSLLQSKKERMKHNTAEGPQQNQPAQYNAPAGNQPQPAQNQPVDPFASNSGTISITDDDLPF